MRRLSVAIRAFFAALFSREAARRIGEALSDRLPAARGERPTPEPRPAGPARSDALSLLSALQREARFIDFVRESLEGATDQQIGAVVRDVHRDCAVVLERMFAIRPLLDQQEGAEIEVPAGFDAARFRLTGNVAGEPPYRGTLGHHGWRATKCELPRWSGSGANVMIICPADVEL